MGMEVKKAVRVETYSICSNPDKCTKVFVEYGN